MTIQPAFNQLVNQGAVLFDLDGTLVDTAPDFVAVIDRLCASYGLTPPSRVAIHATVSSGARALTTLATELTPEDAGFSELNQALLEFYAVQIRHTSALLYPGMAQLLRRLEEQQIPWGVVTNKPERFSTPLLQSLQLDKSCKVLICPDHVTHSKPHPEPLLLACARLGKNSRHCIYVGDHPRDIDAGRAADMLTVAAAYGYLPPAPSVDSWGADHIVHSVDGISDLIWPASP